MTSDFLAFLTERGFTPYEDSGSSGYCRTAPDGRYLVVTDMGVVGAPCLYVYPSVQAMYDGAQPIARIDRATEESVNRLLGNIPSGQRTVAEDCGLYWNGTSWSRKE